MSKRASPRLDCRRGYVRDVRITYERTRRVASGRAARRTIRAKGQDISVLIHDVEGASDCALFYFHGGGWIVGSPETHADISSALSIHTGLSVISIAYRLAPWHKSPASAREGVDV